MARAEASGASMRRLAGLPRPASLLVPNRSQAFDRGRVATGLMRRAPPRRSTARGRIAARTIEPPLLLPAIVADQILADLDLDIGQAPPLAVKRNGVVHLHVDIVEARCARRRGPVPPATTRSAARRCANHDGQMTPICHRPRLPSDGEPRRAAVHADTSRLELFGFRRSSSCVDADDRGA